MAGSVSPGRLRAPRRPGGYPGKRSWFHSAARRLLLSPTRSRPTTSAV